jgi:hypothetical protein
MNEKEFKQHADEVFEEIKKRATNFKRGGVCRGAEGTTTRAITGIMSEIGEVREKMLGFTKWGEFLNNVGARTLFLLERIHEEPCDTEEWKELFIGLLWRKHKRYGHVPLVRWGNLGIVIRIDSKIQRYINMMKNDLDPDGESEVDTLKDIIGYNILLSFNQQGLFPADGSSK